MQLQPGTRLLHFRLEEKIGEGGMGVVWRASDTALSRPVAIKVLPEAVSGDPERLERFEREARLLGSLNHPNIATVHGLHHEGDTHFLSMELVEGEDLSDRIGRGPLAVREACAVALQVSEALEAAHESGVVHRDLKPANIRLGRAGEVKVLDFGLAKAFEASGGGESADASPTLTSDATRAGLIMGTAAYMSPEQAAGQPVDKRCDAWSFGVVLWEMLSGRKLFDGETVSHTLADVLRAEVDWDALPAELPRGVRRLLRRCLERDPRRRLRDMGEARVALEDALAGVKEAPAHEAGAAAEASGSRAPAWLPWTLAGVCAAALLALGAFLVLRPAPAEPRVVQLTLDSPYAGFTRLGDGRLIAISPDGRLVANSGSGSGEDILYIRPLNSFEARPIPATTSARLPFFSPDSRQLGFMASQRLWRINLSGGPPIEIGRAPAFSTGATRGDDGNIYFESSGSIWSIPSAGGEPELILGRDQAPGPLRDPSVLPGSDVLLLASGESSRQPERLYVLDLGTRTLEPLGLQGTDPRYLDTGHLLFSAAGQVMAVAFDRKTLRPSGEPVAVLDRVLVSSGTMHLDVARDGTLVYLPQRQGETSHLMRVDLAGLAEPLVQASMPFRETNDPRFSPDGTKLALSEGTDALWVVDLRSGTPTKISESGFYPVWSTDGATLYYGSTRNETFDLYRRRVDLSAPEELILDVRNNLRMGDVAPNGDLIFREEIPDKGMDLRLWSSPEDASTVRPLLEGPEDELSPEVSRDGRWLAYVSSQSGRDEVYVTSFPTPGARVQVSTAGGTSPTWSPKGDELYYFEGTDFTAVQVAGEPEFRVLGRRVLFKGNYVQYRWQRQYDIHPSGEYFVMLESPATGDAEVVLNWFAELRRALRR